MSTAREKILKTASELMEKQGYHGTGMNEIIQKSGAPKGSLYYYFPDGKEQLASEAILQAGKTVSDRFRERTETEPNAAQAIRDFLYMVAQRMEETNFYTGSTMTMIAMETVATSKRINQACQQGYRMLIEAFRDKLLSGGMDATRAGDMAEMIIAAVEGGIILSRTYQDANHLRRIADHIFGMLKTDNI
jgi:TetR/AcrR family transcriptional regulator, lmrAB and yxaGH operons repressor